MVRVLVAYASKHNSTAEIAQAIGEVLQGSKQLQVSVQSVDSVSDVTAFDVVVLGSAVYAGQWQSSAADFLKRHEQDLAQRSVWLFSSGSTGSSAQNPLKGWAFPEGLQPIADQIKPRDIAVFYGKLDTADLNILERAAVKVVHAETGDFRDWELIRKWAGNIAEALVTA